MTRRNIGTFILLAIFGVAFVFQQPSSAKPTKPRVAPQAWEHLAMPVKGGDFKGADASKKIIELGQQGWQLVDVETYTTNGSTSQTVYFFKREKA